MLLVLLGAVVRVPPAIAAAPTLDDPVAAAHLVALANAERSAAGLPHLQLRSDVATIASDHSRRMAEAGDIAHNDDYFSAGTKGRLDARSLGENVAVNRSMDDAHRRLLASPAHRANLLNPRFTVVGFAVVRAGDGLGYVTQDFVEPCVATDLPSPIAPLPGPAPATPEPASAPLTEPAPAPVDEAAPASGAGEDAPAARPAVAPTRPAARPSGPAPPPGPATPAPPVAAPRPPVADGGSADSGGHHTRPRRSFGPPQGTTATGPVVAELAVGRLDRSAERQPPPGLVLLAAVALLADLRRLLRHRRPTRPT